MSRRVVFNEKSFPFKELVTPPLLSTNAPDTVLYIDSFQYRQPQPIPNTANPIPLQPLPHFSATISTPLPPPPSPTPTLPPFTPGTHSLPTTTSNPMNIGIANVSSHDPPSIYRMIMCGQQSI